MSWYYNTKIADNKPQMSYEEALKIFGYLPNSNPSLDEIKKTYRNLGMKYHPDRGGDIDKFHKLQNANEVLVNKRPSTSTRDSYKETRPSSYKESPIWQTDSRSSNNDIYREDFSDINFCKKNIYEFSITFGKVENWNLIAFDGSFFRHSFTVKTNKDCLHYASLALDTWNSKGGNPYKTEAVIASLGGSGPWQVTRIKGKDVTAKNIILESDGYPINDRRFSEKLKNIINGDVVEASILDLNNLIKTSENASSQNSWYKIANNILTDS